MARTENIFCSKKPSGFSSLACILLEETQISKLWYTVTAKHLRKEHLSATPKRKFWKGCWETKISWSYCKQNRSSEVTALSKLYENLGLHFSICTRTCNLKTFLEREVGGQEKNNTCYCSVQLCNIFNLHGVGTLCSKPLQLPGIMYCQRNQNPFPRWVNAVLKDLIFTHTANIAWGKITAGSCH